MEPGGGGGGGRGVRGESKKRTNNVLIRTDFYIWC